MAQQAAQLPQSVSVFKLNGADSGTRAATAREPRLALS